MKNYEHTYFTSQNLTAKDISLKLQEFGSIGFELVSVVPCIQGGNSQYVTYYFKRVKP